MHDARLLRIGREPARAFKSVLASVIMAAEVRATGAMTAAMKAAAVLATVVLAAVVLVAEVRAAEVRAAVCRAEHCHRALPQIAIDLSSLMTRPLLNSIKACASIKNDAT